MVNVLLLIVSVILGAGRSGFSKRMMLNNASLSKMFYINLSFLFFTSAIAIWVFRINAFQNITTLTWIYGFCFGFTTFLAQWCYTIALSKGPTSICAMIYSFGFIIPTISGAIFWKEPFGLTTIMGFVVAISAIVASAFSDNKQSGKEIGFIIPSLIAMVSAGTLGLLQKLHQNSADKSNLQGFLIIAFLFATVISITFALFSKEETEKNIGFNVFSVAAGACFGLVSFLNTLLAGRMPSAVVFPVLNIGTMLMCYITGIIMFKEKPSKNQKIAFILGILAVIVLSI